MGYQHPSFSRGVSRFVVVRVDQMRRDWNSVSVSSRIATSLPVTMSGRWTERPRVKFFVADSLGFAFRFLAAGNGNDFLENFATDVFQ